MQQKTSNTVDKRTDIKLVKNRAVVVFAIMLLIMVLSSTSLILAEKKSGILQKQIINPLKTWISDFIKSTEEAAKKDNDPHVGSVEEWEKETNVIATSESKIIINEERKVNDNPPVQRKQEIIIVYPTIKYDYPTPVPGRPGSKEWEEEFWRKWDEMEKSNAENQKKVEEAQQKFCQENPTLCD